MPVMKAQRKNKTIADNIMTKSVSMLRSVYIMCLYSFRKDMALITTAQQTCGLKCPVHPPLALRQRVEGTAELVAHDARHVVFEHLDADVP